MPRGPRDSGLGRLSQESPRQLKSSLYSDWLCSNVLKGKMICISLGLRAIPAATCVDTHISNEELAVDQSVHILFNALPLWSSERLLSKDPSNFSGVLLLSPPSIHLVILILHELPWGGNANSGPCLALVHQPISWKADGIESKILVQSA